MKLLLIFLALAISRVAAENSVPGQWDLSKLIQARSRGEVDETIQPMTEEVPFQVAGSVDFDQDSSNVRKSVKEMNPLKMLLEHVRKVLATTPNQEDTKEVTISCCESLTANELLQNNTAAEGVFVVVENSVSEYSVVPPIETVLLSITHDFQQIQQSTSMKLSEKAACFEDMLKALVNIKKIIRKHADVAASFEKTLKLEYEQAICSREILTAVDSQFCRRGKWEYQVGWAVNYSPNWLAPENFNLERLRVYGDLWKLKKAGGNFLSIKLPECHNCGRGIISSLASGFSEIMGVMSDIGQNLQILVDFVDGFQTIVRLIAQLLLGTSNKETLHSVQIVVNRQIDIPTKIPSDGCTVPQKDLYLVRSLLRAVKELRRIGIDLVGISFGSSYSRNGENSDRASGRQSEEPIPLSRSRATRNNPKLGRTLEHVDDPSPSISVTAFTASCLRYIDLTEEDLFHYITLRNVQDEDLISSVKIALNKPVLLHSDYTYEHIASIASGAVVDMPFASEGDQLQRVSELKEWFSSRNIPVDLPQVGEDIN